MTWTHTSRGRALDLLDPQPGDVDLDEIAMALGHQCRYAGCVRRFYSVAEHSVLLSRWAAREGHGVPVQLAMLLHDAAEAYTGDLTYPMQEVLWSAGPAARDAYKAVQASLDRLICDLVGLDPAALHTDFVRTADRRILLDERAVLLTEPPPRPWYGESVLGDRPLGVGIECWQPERATWEWTRTLRELL